ncbi:hypothetical protein HDV00_008328 [Rhizophlyctis rosea]|nr:hypothetical protein HDV00_008328 [Rhizophlyctis rosea]
MASLTTAGSPVLSAEDEHLLKKYLLARQLRTEITALNCTPLSVASLLVPKPTKDVDSELLPANPQKDFPLLSAIFNHLIVPFPALKAADDGPQSFWVTLGKFVGLLLGTVDSGGTRKQTSRRDALADKLVDNFAALLGNAVLTGTEASSKGSNTLDASNSAGARLTGNQLKFDKIEITTTKVIKKKKLLSRTEICEYVISSSLNGRPAVVFRDLAAFKALHSELVRRPNVGIPPLPTLSDCPPPGPTCDAACASLSRYLNSISAPPISSALREFLGQAEPIEHTPSEEEALARAEEITICLEKFRNELVEPGGMKKLMQIVSATNDLNDVPPHYQRVVEWWTMCGAAALHRTLIEDVRAPEHLRRLKAFHRRAPYGSWVAILKGTNPVTVIKAITNILLARPFGVHCLLQNALVRGLDDDAAATFAEIAEVEKLLGDPAKAYQARAFVLDAPLGGYDDDCDLHSAILGYRPEKTSPEYSIVEKLVELHWHIRRLGQFRLLVLQHVTVDLAKDVLNIAYKPLAEAYKVASPGSFVRDLAKFIDDLIKVAESEQIRLYRSTGTSENVPPLGPFVALISRHQHRMYRFVREAFNASPGKAESLADIATWVDSVAEFLRGYGPTIDLAKVAKENVADLAALERDLEKLRARKEKRREAVATRVMRRVRGESKGSHLLDELDSESEGGGDPAAAELQRLWMDVREEEDDRGRSSGRLFTDTSRSNSSVNANEEPFQPRHGATLEVPGASGLSRVRSRSFSELQIQKGEEGEVQEMSEPELEKELMDLVIASDGLEEVGSPVEPPTPELELPLGSGVAGRGHREWVDPLKCEVAGALVEPFMGEMDKWLDTVWKDTLANQHNFK